MDKVSQKNKIKPSEDGLYCIEAPAGDKGEKLYEKYTETFRIGSKHYLAKFLQHDLKGDKRIYYIVDRDKRKNVYVPSEIAEQEIAKWRDAVQTFRERQTRRSSSKPKKLTRKRSPSRSRSRSRSRSSTWSTTAVYASPHAPLSRSSEKSHQPIKESYIDKTWYKTPFF
jgi:hypothetical protein